MLTTPTACLRALMSGAALKSCLTRYSSCDTLWLYCLFQHVSERLSARQEECSEVSTRYSDFLFLVQSEQSFISQLEKRLNKGDDQEVDAEDMAAEMDVSIVTVLINLSISQSQIHYFPASWLFRAWKDFYHKLGSGSCRKWSNQGTYHGGFEDSTCSVAKSYYLYLRVEGMDKRFEWCNQGYDAHEILKDPFLCSE